MKQMNIAIVSIILIVLSLSIVSASWFSSKITGNVVDGTPFDDEAECSDSDEGIFAMEAGAVLARSWWSSKVYPDKCSGKSYKRLNSQSKKITAYPKIKEGYCDNGKQIAELTSEDFGEDGYCYLVKENIKGKKMTVAKWVSLTPSCEEISVGIVRDEAGTTYTSGCQKEQNSFIQYSCNENETEKIEEIADCSLLGEFGRCVKTGCMGACNETDVENNIDAPGLVILDEIEYPDVCNTKGTHVRQYACSKGKLKKLGGDHPWKNCGKDRICVIDENTGAGYCKAKGLASETTTLEGLRRIVNSLQETISSLQNRIAVLEGVSSSESGVE